MRSNNWAGNLCSRNKSIDELWITEVSNEWQASSEVEAVSKNLKDNVDQSILSAGRG